MQLLLITYSFPPAESPRAHRWGAIADYFAASGVGIEVICAGTSDSRLVRPSGAMVNTVLPGFLQASREKFIRKNSSEAVRSPRAGWAHRIARTAVSALRWPDYSSSWINPACKVAERLIRENEYSAIISVSLPFAAHIVADRLHRAGFGGAWIADVGDPFSLAENSSQGVGALFLARSQRAERRILNDCTRWSVTDSGARDALVAELGVAPDRAVVIPPLLPPMPDTPQDTRTLALRMRPAPLSFAYAGLFYDKIRPVERLARFGELLLKQLGENQFSIDIYGANDQWQDRMLRAFPASATHVRFLGTLARSVLFRRLGTYDALVNLGNSTRFQVPSKVVEYAALGVPIVNVKGQFEDTSERLLDGYDRGWSILVPDSYVGGTWEREATQSLSAFLDSPWSSDQNASSRDGWMRRFSVETIALRYLSALELPVVPGADE